MLQRQVDEMDRLQREDYPHDKNRSRMELFPELRYLARPYDAAQEYWQWQRVADHLSEYTAARRVERSGVVWLYNRKHYVGSKYGGATVYVSFDPVDCEWIFRDERGNELRSRFAEELTEANIRALQVSGHHGKTQTSGSTAKPRVP